MSVITGLMPNSRAKRRTDIEMDGDYSLTISTNTLNQLRLEEGDEADLSELIERVRESETQKAKESASYYLGKAARSEAQVVKFLESLGYHEQFIAPTMQMLIEGGYLDDATTAKDYAEYLLETKRKGRHAIKLELKKRLYDDETIEQALGALKSDDELDSAVALTHRAIERYGDPQDPLSRKKVTDFLARRGYGFETIRQAIRLAREED